MSSVRREVWLFLLLAGLTAASVFLGRYPNPGFSAAFLTGADPLGTRIFLYLRLPRIIAALLTGCSLGAAGFTFQQLFKNPLVEPGFLGVSQGAAFGAALAILYFHRIPGSIQISAVAFSFGALSLSYFIATKIGFGGWIIRMVISGLSVSALFASGVGLLKYSADHDARLREMTFWMLGGLQNSGWRNLLPILPVVVPGLAVLFAFRRKLDVLSLDDRTAFSLSADPARERLLLLVSASAITACVTAMAGIIGWVGLLVPHLARSVSGSGSPAALRESLVIGGIMVLACDTLGRTLFPAEIPLGILTSISGAGLFLFLLNMKRVRISR